MKCCSNVSARLGRTDPPLDPISAFGHKSSSNLEGGGGGGIVGQNKQRSTFLPVKY